MAHMVETRRKIPQNILWHKPSELLAAREQFQKFQTFESKVFAHHYYVFEAVLRIKFTLSEFDTHELSSI